MEEKIIDVETPDSVLKERLPTLVLWLRDWGEKVTEGRVCYYQIWPGYGQLLVIHKTKRGSMVSHGC